MNFTSSNQSRLSALNVGQGVYLLSAGGKTGSACLTATSCIGRRQNRVTHRKPNMRTSNILLLFLASCAMLLETPLQIKAAPLIDASEVEQAITNLQNGGDLARSDLVRNLIELENRHADEPSKIRSLDSLIRLGAAVLSTRNRSVDTKSKIGIWPAFDALAYGAKFPIFAGTDPASITDARLRKAYEVALTKHKETLAVFSQEKQKDAVASESFAACKRLLNEIKSPRAVEQVKQSLAKLANDPWLADSITASIFPPESKAEPTSSDQLKPANASNDAASLNPHPVVQSPSLKKVPEAKTNSTTPSEEPASSTPLSVIVVMIVAVTGLLWQLLKRRS
jgi:hypothetical protein